MHSWDQKRRAHREAALSGATRNAIPDRIEESLRNPSPAEHRVMKLMHFAICIALLKWRFSAQLLLQEISSPGFGRWSR
jgi:hypothetical protein